MDAASIVQLVLLSLGGLVAIGGVASTVWAIAKVNGMQSTIGLITAGNEELRSQLKDERETRGREQVECARQISHMQGQLDALTGDFAARLVTAVAAGMKATGGEL
jgi:hypothetical protein